MTTSLSCIRHTPLFGLTSVFGCLGLNARVMAEEFDLPLDDVGEDGWLDTFTVLALRELKQIQLR